MSLLYAAHGGIAARGRSPTSFATMKPAVRNLLLQAGKHQGNEATSILIHPSCYSLEVILLTVFRMWMMHKALESEADVEVP